MLPLRDQHFAYDCLRCLSGALRSVAPLMAGVISVAGAIGCGSADTASPSLGSLTVSIRMSGVDVPATGVSVTLDGSRPVQVANDSDYAFGLVAAGQHQVSIIGLAKNCTSSEDLTQTPRVTANAVDTVGFAFACTLAALDSSGLIAFERGDAQGYLDIWVMNSNGTGERNLTNSLGVSDVLPSWMPDGHRLVFVRDAARVPEFAMIGSDGSGLTDITTGFSEMTWPVVSPDGSHIAFAMATAGTGYDIWVMNIDGSNRTRLTSDPGDDGSPTWSPDGARIAFAEQIGLDTSFIYVMNADGSDTTRLSPLGSYDSYPAWSPDGSRIVFERIDKGPTHIFVMFTDGSGAVALTSGPRSDQTPSWSADGSRIVFETDRGTAGIAVMKADGSGLTVLSPPGVYDGFPVWGR